MNRRFAVLLGALLCMPIVAVFLVGMTTGFHDEPLPDYGVLPPFELVERGGEHVSLDAFRGKVWIASFIFTHCALQCPRITKTMRGLQDQLGLKTNLRLVSFSVDPARDTPAVLRAYAEKAGADPNKWLFLTGDKKRIDSLAKNGFRLGSEGEGDDIIHSDRLVLVDGTGRIRGYYDGNDADSLKGLVWDAKRLIRETTI